jgi:hypothetical protein
VRPGEEAREDVIVAPDLSVGISDTAGAVIGAAIVVVQIAWMIWVIVRTCQEPSS